MIDYAPYAHLGITGNEPLIKRKFRWTARLFKNRTELGKAALIKLDNRPNFSPDRNNHDMPDLEVVLFN